MHRQRWHNPENKKRCGHLFCVWHTVQISNTLRFAWRTMIATCLQSKTDIFKEFQGTGKGSREYVIYCQDLSWKRVSCLSYRIETGYTRHRVDKERKRADRWMESTLEESRWLWRTHFTPPYCRYYRSIWWKFMCLRRGQKGRKRQYSEGVI